MNININVKYISAERLLDMKPKKTRVQINTSVNIITMEWENEVLVMPFVFSITYRPPFGTVNFKGDAIVSGQHDELVKIYKTYEKKEPPPVEIIQTIANVLVVESSNITRLINIPPCFPLPNIPKIGKKGKKEDKIGYRA